MKYHPPAPANWTGPKRTAWEELMKATPSPSFLERLEPELTLQDLEQRANKAYEIAQAAQQAGDTEKFERAVERMLLRFSQWDDLAQPEHERREVYRRRLDQVCELLEPMEGGDALAVQLVGLMYFFAERSEGQTASAATARTVELMDQWDGAVPVPTGSSTAPAFTATNSRAARAAG